MTNTSELRYDINTINIKTLENVSSSTIHSEFISPNLFEVGCTLYYNEFLLKKFNSLDKINKLENYKKDRLSNSLKKKYKDKKEIQYDIYSWLEIILGNITGKVKKILTLYHNEELHNALSLVKDINNLKFKVFYNNFDGNHNAYFNKIIKEISSTDIIFGNSGVYISECLQIKYLLTQFSIMLHCLDNNGIFIYRIGGLYTKISIKLLYLCNYLFNKLRIIKPVYNSILKINLYVICEGFNKNKAKDIKNEFLKIIKDIDTKEEINDILTKINISPDFINLLNSINLNIQEKQLIELNNITDNENNIDILKKLDENNNILLSKLKL